MSEELKNTATPPEGGENPEPAPVKMFTQEELNGIVAKESRASVEKLLKEAGIASEGDYKASLKVFRDWQESQKTELEKTNGNLSAEQAARAAAEARVEALERRLTAVSKGVPAEKSEKYIKLAEAYLGEKTDFPAALDMALKDFPVVPPGVPGASGNPPPAPAGNKAALPKGVVSF